MDVFMDACKSLPTYLLSKQKYTVTLDKYIHILFLFAILLLTYLLFIRYLL